MLMWHQIETVFRKCNEAIQLGQFISVSILCNCNPLSRNRCSCVIDGYDLFLCFAETHFYYSLQLCLDLYCH